MNLNQELEKFGNALNGWKNNEELERSNEEMFETNQNWKKLRLKEAQTQLIHSENGGFRAAVAGMP